MKLRVVSDLHFEFHRDGGWGLAQEISEGQPFDVLVVAGDLCDGRGLEDSLEFLAERIQRPIVYVLGNHELYLSSPTKAFEVARKLEAKIPHLHVLERQAIEIEGQRFVGATLWYPHPVELSTDRGMGDFNYIEGFAEWVHPEAVASAAYLEKEILPGDVVVTHFLPHLDSILPLYRQSKINGYFVHNVGGLVEKKGAKLWIHGHTHGTLDYHVGSTRVVCNPHGYVGTIMAGEPNRNFNPHLNLQV